MLHSPAHRNQLNFSLYLLLSSLIWACFHGCPVSGLFPKRSVASVCSCGGCWLGPAPEEVACLGLVRLEVTGSVLLQCRSLTQCEELSFPFGNTMNEIINVVYLNNAFYLILEINLVIGIIAKNFAKEMPMPTWSTGV